MYICLHVCAFILVRWPRKGDESILLNICGRLLLLQQDPVSRTADITNNNTQVRSIEKFNKFMCFV